MGKTFSQMPLLFVELVFMFLLEKNNAEFESQNLVFPKSVEHLQEGMKPVQCHYVVSFLPHLLYITRHWLLKYRPNAYICRPIMADP